MFAGLMSKKGLSLIALFVILTAIPLTVFLSQQRQEIRQRAEEIQAPTFNISGNCNTWSGNASLSSGGDVSLDFFLDGNKNPNLGIKQDPHSGNNVTYYLGGKTISGGGNFTVNVGSEILNHGSIYPDVDPRSPADLFSSGQPIVVSAYAHPPNDWAPNHVSGRVLNLGSCSTPTPTPTPPQIGGAPTWIPPTCTGGTFSGCTLSGEPVCNNYGDPKIGRGTEISWGVCNNICSTADRNASCDGNTLRPPLCERTWTDKTSITSRDSITINSKAKIPLNKFMFAFYNPGNMTSTGPQPIFYEGNQHYTPTVELPGPQFQTFRTFSYQDLARPDNNWGGRIPTNIQVNGYFFDDQGNLSRANPACVASFTLAVAPTLTPTPTPLAADVDRNGCVGIVDFNLWLRAYQSGTAQPGTSPDINGDGKIDLLDFNAWYIAMRSLAGTDRLCQ